MKGGDGQVGRGEEGRQQLVAARDAGEVEDGEAVGAHHLVDVELELGDEAEAAGHILRILAAALHQLAQLRALLSLESRGGSGPVFLGG